MEPTRAIPAGPPQGLSIPDTAWTGRSRGGYFGNWFFVQLIRCLGVWPAYFWLLFVSAYFTLAHATAYRASAEFLEHVFGPLPPWRCPLLVYRHFLNYGITLVDRLAVLMGCYRVKAVFDGREAVQAELAKGRGVILVGAHIGCWELGGHFLEGFSVPVNIVMIERELANIQKLLNSAAGASRFRILTSDAHPLRSIPILAALRRGEIVALHGDRSFGGADAETDFLGERVRLPEGPYRLAAVSGARLFQAFVVREALGTYRFVAIPMEWKSREDLRSDPNVLLRQTKKYAMRLEEFVRKYPFQWANFYSYWAPNPQRESPPCAKG
jgi:predicted LPLAT superfamily acyltransferase